MLNDELNKKMILDVDKSKVVSENIIESPILGQISLTISHSISLCIHKKSLI